MLVEQNLTEELVQAVSTPETANYLLGNLLTTLVIVITLVGLRFALVRFIRGKEETIPEENRRWLIRVKNLIWVLIVFSIILIWAPQLRSFALSVTAIAVAIVIATKELIACFAGAVMRVSTQAFDVGDWIHVNHFSGEVIDITAFSFRLQEIDFDGKTYTFTGKTVTVPNSILLSHAVQKLHFMKDFVFKDFSVTLKYNDFDPGSTKKQLEAIADKHYERHRQAATDILKKIKRKSGFEMDKPEPHVSFRTTDIGNQVYTVTLFVPTRLAQQTATDISVEFLSQIHTLKKEQGSDSGSESET